MRHQQHSSIRHHAVLAVLLGVLATVFMGCASARDQRRGPTAEGQRPTTSAATGDASYYASKFQGRPTANGERFDNGKLTAAHRTLPFGTRIRVTNLYNGRSVTVRVNDRGPFVKGRVIDLSQAAARRIDMVRAGVVQVRLEPVGGQSHALARTD
jgi:rare lipoprotein A